MKEATEGLCQDETGMTQIKACIQTGLQDPT